MSDRESHHKGWYVPRGLPHFDSPDVMQAITFRLADSLPRDVLIARKDDGDAAHRRKIAALLDAGFGSCMLREPATAALVEAALLHGDSTGYKLHAWVIMPNHVHVLMALSDGHRLPDIVRGWKSWTSRVIKASHIVPGAVWQREYFDRYMRDGDHAEATVHYIEQNPVSAGLVAEPREWRFGSAWWRANGSRG